MVEVSDRVAPGSGVGWFERLYSETRDQALAYARRLVGPADADDVVQEVFLRLARYRPAGGEDIGIKFVVAVVKNVAMNFLNRRPRDGAQSREGRHDWRECTEGDGHSLGTTTGWAREQLESLPSSHREAFVLVEVFGLSESQAGLAMHLSRPVVGAEKRCATEALRDKARRLNAGPPTSGARLCFTAHRLTRNHSAA